MIELISRRWVFTAAQTDLSILAPASVERIAIHKVTVTAANTNSGDVSVDIGIATTTLPTITNNSATGGLGIAFSHPGIAKGGGAVENGGETPLVVGAAADPIRLTCSAATGGAIRVIIAYRLIDTTAAP